MVTTPFAAEHELLRDSVRRLVQGRLEPLATQVERGGSAHLEAVALCADLGGLDDVLADVVVAEELGRLRSWGLVTVLLDALLVADLGLPDSDLTAVARSAQVEVVDGRARGSLPFLVGGAAATRCVVVSEGLLLTAPGWTVQPLAAPHALRGGAVADVTLSGVGATAVIIDPVHLRRAELREAAAAVSAARVTFTDAMAYAGQRMAFGRPIGRFQVNRHTLVELDTWIAAAEALVHEAAWDFDVASTTAARLNAGSVAVRVADACLQLHGGYGYTEEFDVARAWRDSRSLLIGDTQRRRRLTDPAGNPA